MSHLTLVVSHDVVEQTTPHAPGLVVITDRVALPRPVDEFRMLGAGVARGRSPRMLVERLLLRLLPAPRVAAVATPAALRLVS